MPHRGGQDHYNVTSSWLAERRRAPGATPAPRAQVRVGAGCGGPGALRDISGAEGRAGVTKPALTRQRVGAFVKKVS